MSCFKCPYTLDDKSVTFNNKVKIIHYQQTPVESDVCWQQVARDRMRFKRRILEVERNIAWVFSSEHRNRMHILVHKQNI
jgi:hypothetical protein